MQLTIQQLRTPVTEEQALETILRYLQAVGFNASSWQTGSLQRKFLRFASYVYSDLTDLVAKIVDFGFNETASGAALTEFSRSHYDNERSRAIATVGKMRLTNSGQNPQTITPSELVAAFTLPDGTQLTYRNVDGGTVSSGGGTLDLDWVAEQAGSDWNIPNNSTLTLTTAIAGVTVTNPAVAGTSTWITTMGVDRESDETLRTRNRTKWSTLSVEAIRETVENLALNAAPNVTRVDINDSTPLAAGGVGVYLASATGAAATADVAAVQTAFDARFFGNSVNRRVTALPAIAAPLDITATVYFSGDFTSSEIETAVDETLEDFLATIPIGGFEYAASYAYLVPVEEITNVIRNTEINGLLPVSAVVISVPAADVNVSSWNVVTRGTWTLTCTAVV